MHQEATACPLICPFSVTSFIRTTVRRVALACAKQACSKKAHTTQQHECARPMRVVYGGGYAQQRPCVRRAAAADYRPSRAAGSRPNPRFRHVAAASRPRRSRRHAFVTGSGSFGEKQRMPPSSDGSATLGRRRPFSACPHPFLSLSVSILRRLPPLAFRAERREHDVQPLREPTLVYIVYDARKVTVCRLTRGHDVQPLRERTMSRSL